MTSIPTWRALGLSGLGLLAFQAQSQEQSFYYGGLSVGQSQTNLEEDHITQSQTGNSLTVTDISRNERDTAYKLFAGYQFNEFYAMEGGYFTLGKPHFTASTSPAGTLHGEVKLQGWNLDLIGMMPFTPSLSGLARVGVHSTKASDQFRGTGAVVPADPSPSERHTSYKFGAGLQYAITPSMLIRGELERYRVADGMGNRNGVNVASLSLVFPFGRSSPPVRHALAEPAYVAPIPMPAEAPAAGTPPPMVMAVATPERKRVTFSAESLFGFDASQVQADGKRALDGFAKELEGTLFSVINVEGHTDRLGSQTYNQHLSEQRAEAVKNYLVETGKVDAGKISATGKSESMPITKPEDCKGSKPTARLIECLQPDRRVEIEVVGTR
ncbi:MAG TPA: OmpA family protein [Aquabacterium sp.]|uniref:OmpA family protein n=1 Tax=Aquabacterium sp. TaxID=1872578 RepID=UPI002E346534|nr:OmpA family protein [Aquabacterium sp.]HEX5357152.1 OmpA family protein [Aquabacterium sp.]